MKKPHIAVIGAGAFGGWTALFLAERGARVTLVDAWGAGHLRGTSSGETRIIRCGYGTRPIYAEWAWRALAEWKKRERQWRTPLFVNSGVLWLCTWGDAYTEASLGVLRRYKIPHKEVAIREVQRRWPQFSTRGLDAAYLEHRAGFLRARVATMAVARAAERAGARMRIAQVAAPVQIRKSSIKLADGQSLRADGFVFACGPWLPQLFPDVLGRRIVVTKQEVLFFGPPPGDTRFDATQMPAWIEPASDFYGIPASDARGLKIADDSSGPFFDPTAGDRSIAPQSVGRARDYLARRIPTMARAPLVESRVCQYERTPDSHLVLDRHPQHENVWLAGGGSGHGFKLGPAVGDFLSRQVLGARNAGEIPSMMRVGACEWPDPTKLPTTHSF